MHLSGKFAMQGANGGACRLFRAAVDKICNGFRLCQIQLVVKKRALGKFARAGAACTKFQHALQQQVHNHRAAVAVQFKHVFAGKRGRRRKIQGQPGIDEGAVRCVEVMQTGMACRR
jgi:hypothetical protein